MANTSSIDRDLNFSQEEVIDGNPKVKTHNIDMGKYGPLSYRDLQKLSGIKDDGPTNLSEDELKELDNLSANLGTGDISFSDIEEYDIQSPLMAQGSYWGESMFDPEGTLSPEGLENISDIRANNQPGIVKLAAGLGKMGVLAVTTAVDGILGTVAGIVNMAANASNINSLSEAGEYFVRNPLSEGLQAINEASESWMPNYYTMNELQNDENGEWYKNVFTANFWGDKFIKNVGFTLGAAASAILTSGAASKVFVSNELRNAFKGTVFKATKEGGKEALNTGEQVYKAMRNGEQLFRKTGKGAYEVIEEGSKLMKDLQESAKQLKRAEWGLKLAGSVNSAMGEGRIEAIGAVKELQEKEYNNINNWANNAIEGVSMELYNEHPEWFSLVNVGTTDNPRWENQLTSPEGLAEYERRTKYITDKQNALLQQASMKSADIANYVFLSNVALLSFSNFVQFGRAMSGGFTTANNFKNLIKNVTKNEAKKEVGKEALKETTKRLGEEGVEAAINKGAIRRKIARAAASPLMEGFEEISQASITTGAGLQIGSELNQYAKEYNTGLMYDSLYADSIDSDAQETAVSYLNSLLDGAAKTYGKSQSWEEFSIGFLTGMLGIPKVGRKANGKKGLQMSGEFWEGIKDAKQMKKEAQELVNAINARINTPEMKEYYKGLIRHTKGEKDKLDFLMRDDQFNYNNSEFKQLISDALMFDKAGRLEDFYSMIDDYAKLTGDEQESLRTIIANSKYNVTDANGNIVRDANGNPVQKTMYDGYSIERMNAELKKRADKARKAVDFYVKNSNNLKALYGDSISQDVLAEMVYGLSQLDNWSDRSREMMSDISRALHGDFSTAKEYGVGVENIDEDIIKSFEDVQTLFGKGDKNIINTLLNAIKKGNLAPEDFVKYYDKLQTMKSHKKNLMESTKERMSAADKETVKTLVEELNTYKQNKEIDVKVKENILNNILSLAKTLQDKIDLFQMDFNLMEDFKEVLDEAIDTLGTATVAKKIVEWKNFLNKSIVTSKFAERKNSKVLSTAEALNNLYKSLYANTEEEEQAFKEKLEKELATSNKEKKNAIKENYLKSVRKLNDIIEDINTKLHNIKNVNNINLLKYEKMINDLVLIQASREAVLSKLKDLSEHPEYYTEAAQEYLKEAENKIKEQASEQLKRKLANCKTVQDIREVFENDDISTFSKQQEMLNSIVNDVNEDLQSLIKDYIKIEKFKIATLSVDSKSNETNADISSKVILKVLNTIDEAQDFNSIIENLEFTKFSKDLSKEEKEYAKGFLERIFTAYNASENTKKDKKEEPTEKSVESKTTNSRLRNMVNKDVAEMEKESMQQSKEDGIPENVPTGETEAEDNSQDDDTIEENSNKEYLEKLSKKGADEQVASLNKKSIEKLEEIEKDANEEQKKLIEEVKKGKPTKELPNYTNNTVGQESVKFPNNKQTDIVDETKNTVGNTLADNSGRMAFDNWTYTLYNIYAAKKALMQTNTFNGEKFAENAQKYLSFMSEYNADRYINEGFLGLKYLKAKREGKEVKIHLLQIADSRMEYSRPNNQNTNEKHYTILQCVALDENEVKELENTWGKNKVKLIKNEYTVEGKKKTEYYQVVGSLHYSNNNFEAKSLKGEDAEFYKNFREAKFKTTQDRIDFINKSLLDNSISESLSKALIKEKQILEMSKMWFAINSSFEQLREKAITNNSVDSNLSIVQGSNDENKVKNSMGTEKSGPYIIKNSQMQSAIKTIYSGRLVKGTLDSNLNPNDKANIENANWQGETDLKDIPLNNNGEKLNGNTLQLGFYYGNGTLAIPLASSEDEVVPLKANNNKFIASTGPDGKLYNTAGSVWIMVRTADGKLYPKGLSVKRFNEKEYPKEKYFNRNDASAKTIMNIIYSNAKVMADPNASQTEKARAKVAIMNVLYIPKKYSFGFDNDGKTVYINNKNGGYSRSVSIDVEAIKNADEETQRTLINDYAEQIIDALHDNQFSFRFQVSPSRVKKDGDGSYRQLLLDSNVFTTNLPVLENIGASFDTYPILHDGKKWKVVKDGNVNVEKSTSVPKSTGSMSNNNNDIKYGEYSFIVKEENGTLTVIPNVNAQNTGKKTASPEEQCAIKLLYNLNKGITNGEVVKGSNIYSVTTNAGNHTFYFEVDESNKLIVKKLEGTLEEITQRANTKLNNKKMNSQENLVSDSDLNELAKLQEEVEELSSVMGNQSSTDSMNKEIEEALQDDADFTNGGVRQEKQEKPVETKEEKSVSSNLEVLQQNVEQQGKTRQTVASDKKLKLMAINRLNKKAKEKGYESYDKFVKAHQDNSKIIPTTDPIFDTLTKETAQTITDDIIKCM